MRAIVRTNDIVLISLVQSILEQADVPVFVADTYFSSIEGSIGIFPRRILVPVDWMRQARRLLVDAGLEAELEPVGTDD
jgi:hypothetical protein